MDSAANSRVFELMRAIDGARRGWKHAGPDTDINKSQFFTLMTLFRRGSLQGDPSSPMTLSALAEAMEQTMPAVSQRVTKLEALGYVERRPDQRDRRTVWIGLTDQGLATLEDTRKTMFAHMDRVIALMEQNHPGSVQDLIHGCNSLVEALREEFPQ